jgi:hypothetical protein
MRDEQSFWRKCSSCKIPIEFKAKYYVCSVSTCNSLRTGYVFCSVTCFEKHLPGARHRDAAAVEKIAGATPYMLEGQADLRADLQTPQSVPQRKMATHGVSAPVQKNQIPKDVLVVVSKLKDYIKARGDMSTSQGVVDILSDQMRRLCDDAIDRARVAGRKTVLERDFKV